MTSPGDVSGRLWEPQASPRRGPRPTLTVEAIAEAGIVIADVDGLAAVAMQRVAAALGVTKMALYRYVPGKVELVALMTDLAIGGPPPFDALPEGWRPRLDAWAREMFARFWAHPWALEATVGARPIGPNELSWMEQAVVALDGAGLDGGEMLDVAATLAGHVRNIAQQGSAVAGGDAEGAMSVSAALVRGREDRFPVLTAAIASAVEHGSQNNAFDFGLARILDGVELLVTRRRGGEG